MRTHFHTDPQQLQERLEDSLHNDDNLPLAQTVSHKTLAIMTSKDHLPHSSNPSPHTPSSNVRKLVPPLPRENYGGLVRNPGDSEIYEQRYQMPQLSDEKADWIDAWRNSLAELVASDPQIKLAPPVIEPVKDDDTMSLGSEMTSITTRARLKAEEETDTKSVYGNATSLRRRVTSGSRHSARKPSANRRKVASAARLNIVAPAPEISCPVKEEKIELSEIEANEYMTPRIQRKRSTDVKNWIEPERRPSYSRAVRTSSIRRPGFKRTEYVRPSSTPAVYSLNFFQSNTPSDDTDSPQDTGATWPANGAEDNGGLKYHSSVRGKVIQLVKPKEKNKATLVRENPDTSGPPSRSPTPTSKRSSAPPTSQMPTRIPHHHSSSSLRSEQMVSSSPLTNIMVNNAQAKRHSDMSSLELGGDQRRRSSRGMMNEDMADSSQNSRGATLAGNQQMMWQKHYQLQHQQQQQAAAIAAYQYPYAYGNMPSLVSPAIPPVSMPTSLMSSFPRNVRSDQFADDKYIRATAYDTPAINKRQQQQQQQQRGGYYPMNEGKGYYDASISDEFAHLRMQPKSSVVGSDYSSKSRRPESWMANTAQTPHDLRAANRRSLDSFKLLDQRTAIRQPNHS